MATTAPTSTSNRQRARIALETLGVFYAMGAMPWALSSAFMGWFDPTLLVVVPLLWGPSFVVGPTVVGWASVTIGTIASAAYYHWRYGIPRFSSLSR